MRTWLFQSVPAEFRLVDFFNCLPKKVLWKCTRFGGERQAGDRVYLWQAIGDGSRGISGIFADGHIRAKPVTSIDDEESAGSGPIRMKLRR